MSKIVDRTLDFLELFGTERRPLLLTDISRLLSLPISSCHDVLRALLARGYMYQLSPRGAYYPTLRLRELGKLITEHDPVAQRSEIVLRRMRDALDESVLLSKVQELNATYLLVFEPSHPLRFQAKIGDSIRSLYGTSAGKVILSSLSDQELTALLNSAPLTPLTSRSITSKAALRKNIQEGVKRGWFMNDGETLEGVMTLSASFVWDKSVYIVTIAGHAPRIKRQQKLAVKLLNEACQELGMAA